MLAEWNKKVIIFGLMRYLKVRSTQVVRIRRVLVLTKKMIC